MKNPMVIIAVLALFFLAACAPQEPVAPQLPVGEEPPAPLPDAPVIPGSDAAPAVDDVQEIDDALDATFGARDGEQVITVDDVRCDAATRTVTFRFRNLDTRSWQLNQEVPFPAPKDLAGVRVTLNSYEMNGIRKPLDPSGVELFGPGAKFSDNCGGTTVLAPGEEAICTVTPVVIKAETTVSQGANELIVNGVGKDGNVRFACS